MKSHNEFLKDVEVESSLPAQTCRTLGPESQEDISMYANSPQAQSNQKGCKSTIKCDGSPEGTELNDVDQKGGEQ